MRYANIKKASQKEKQNQTTTANKNYIKNFVRFKKKQKFITKSKQRQIKKKLNNLICISPERISDLSIIKLDNN